MKDCLYDMLEAAKSLEKENTDLKLHIQVLQTQLEEKSKKITEIEQIVIPTYDFDIMTLAEVKQYKINEIGNANTQAIHNGFSAELSVGTKHFALTLEDQVNIMGLQILSQINNGNPIPYHADGEPCTLYTTEDVTLIITGALKHKLYCTTYCNLLNTYIRDYCKTKSQVLEVSYGDALITQLDDRLIAFTGVSSGKK
jgi:hypothetical protein